MDVFTNLTADWRTTASRPAARQAIAAWAQRAPALDGFAAPAELVLAINQPGGAGQSCTLLSELLVIASCDQLAARAVLLAVTPGLRTAVTRRWRVARWSGPWRDDDEIAIDGVAAAWETICAHAGQRHPRPARMIIRHVEGSLRRAHTRWLQNHTISAALSEDLAEPSETAHDAARSPEQQAAILIAEAARSGVIDHREAALLAAVGVLGYSAGHAEVNLGLSPGSSRRMLRHARQSIKAWNDDRHRARPVHREKSCDVIFDFGPSPSPVCK